MNTNVNNSHITNTSRYPQIIEIDPKLNTTEEEMNEELANQRYKPTYVSATILSVQASLNEDPSTNRVFDLESQQITSGSNEALVRTRSVVSNCFNNSGINNCATSICARTRNVARNCLNSSISGVGSCANWVYSRKYSFMLTFVAITFIGVTAILSRYADQCKPGDDCREVTKTVSCDDGDDWGGHDCTTNTSSSRKSAIVGAVFMGIAALYYSCGVGCAFTGSFSDEESLYCCLGPMVLLAMICQREANRRDRN